MDAACGETYKLLLLSCNCLGLQDCTMKASTHAYFEFTNYFLLSEYSISIVPYNVISCQNNFVLCIKSS